MSAELSQYFRDPFKVWYFALNFDSPHPIARMTSIWANQHSRWFGLPYGDPELLVSCVLLTAVEGYVDHPLVENVAVAQRLKGRLNPFSFTLTTSTTRHERSG